MSIASSEYKEFAAVPLCDNHVENDRYTLEQEKIKISVLNIEILQSEIPLFDAGSARKIAYFTLSSGLFALLAISTQCISKTSLGTPSKILIDVITIACATAITVRVAIKILTIWMGPSTRKTPSQADCYVCNQFKRLNKKIRKQTTRTFKHISNLITATFFSILLGSLKNPKIPAIDMLPKNIFRASGKSFTKQAAVVLLVYAVYSGFRAYQEKQAFDMHLNKKFHCL